MKKIYILGALILLTFSFQIVNASAFPDGCSATTKFSATTGHSCAISQTCVPGDLFDSMTGKPCKSGGYPIGCNSFAGFSTITGQKCDGSIPAPAIQIQQYVPAMPTSSSSGSLYSAILEEYRTKLAAFEQQIINIKNYFYQEKAGIEKGGGSMPSITGQINKAMSDANTKINIIQLQEQQLNLDYQDKLHTNYQDQIMQQQLQSVPPQTNGTASA
jgi:hypothetical protein